MPDNAFIQLINNVTLWTAIFACLLAQALKVLIEYWRTKTWKTALFYSTGSMPSSHAAMVTSMMMMVGLREGFGTTMFAVSAVLAMVVTYDAAGVRRAAGKQAEAINFIFSKLEDQGITFDKKLKELLGHSPIEVAAGAILGVLVAVASYGLIKVG